MIIQILRRVTMDVLEKNRKLKASKDSIFKCRYLVAILGFLSFTEINTCRLTTSMSLVAMVNITAITFNEVLNNVTISCPLNYTDETETEILKNDGEFDWNPAKQGYILGSSFIGFICALMPGGILAETYGSKIIIMIGLFLSSVCHFVSPFAAWSSSHVMIAVQVLRGFGQGLVPAAQSVLCSNWFPKSERGFLNSLMLLGYTCGTLIGGFTSGLLCSSSLFGGWPSVYYIYGVLGIVLCMCFYVFIFESPKCHPRINADELDFILKDQETDLSLKRPPTPWKEILTSGPVYAMTYASVGVYWVVAHYISVQPIFLGTILQFSIKENGFFTSAPVAFQVIITFAGSLISKWLNAHSYVEVGTVRKWCNILFSLGYTFCMVGVYFAGCQRVLSASLTAASLAFIGLSFSGCLIAPFDMSPTFAGTLTGFQSTIGCLSCFIFPILVGIMTNEKQTLEEWNKIFLISIFIVLSSGIIFCLFGSVEVQSWNYPATDTSQINKSNCKEQIHETKAVTDVIRH